LIVLASLALPQSTCVKYVSPSGETTFVAPQRARADEYQRIAEHSYALDSFSASDAASWVLLVTFLWPTVFAGHALLRPPARSRRVLRWVEPLLLIGSVYVVWHLALFETRALGNYLALGGFGVYALGWALTFRQRRAPAPSGAPN
jgi:hypothetical protein